MAGILLGILFVLLFLIGFILILTIVLLLIRYQVYFFKDSEITKVKIKLGFIKVYEIPAKKSKKAKEKKYDEKKEKLKKIFFDKKENDIKIQIGDTQLGVRAVSENFSFISEDLKDIFNIIFDMIKYFGKSLSLKFLNIQIVVSCSDVSDTGKNYGILCSVFYPVMDLISEKIKIKKHFYDLGYNFNETRPYYKIEGQARLRGFHLLALALKAFGIFPKVDNIKENINKRAV